jgi:D-arabinitol 4-dehydrogenase
MPPDSAVILHIGLGAFHRAHQACFHHRLRQQGKCGWSLVAGNLRADSLELERVLVAQQGRYTLETVAPGGARTYTQIDAIDRVIPYAPDARELIDWATDPRTRILSFTITEAGYHVDALGRLQTDHPDVVADLHAVRNGGGPVRGLYGFLARALQLRRDNDAGPLTLLCCDNLRRNGGLTRSGLTQFLRASGDSKLAEWVVSHCTFPNTMVDRITPRPTPELRVRILASTGIDDAAGVMAEEHLQWVLEERFAAGRPDWNLVGAQFVDSVDPYEEAKTRVLNASHSIIGWAGALAGHRFVHEAVADVRVRQLAWDFTTAAAIPGLLPSPIDLPAYRDAILVRFGNEAIADTLERIVADSYAKLREFIVPTLIDCARFDRLPLAAWMAPALFLAFLNRSRSDLLAMDYRDAALPASLGTAAPSLRASIDMLCADADLWGPLRDDARLATGITSALQLMTTRNPWIDPGQWSSP